MPMDDDSTQAINAGLSQAPTQPLFTFIQHYKSGKKWKQQEYEVNFREMMQRNTSVNTRRKIKAVWQGDDSKEFSWQEHLDTQTPPGPPGPAAPPPQGQGNLADDSSANTAWIPTPQDSKSASIPSGGSSGSQWKEDDKPQVAPEVGDGKSPDTVAEWQMPQVGDRKGSWANWHGKQ